MLKGFTFFTILLFAHTSLSIDATRLDIDNPNFINQSFKEKEATHQVLDRMIENVEFLQAHEEDFIDLFPEQTTEATLSSINKNLASYKHILSLLDGLKSGKNDVHTVLLEMLQLRVSLIKSRRNNTESYENAKKNGTFESILYGPTNPLVYDSLSYEQQVLAQKATDLYQMFNRVILGLLFGLDTHSLPPKITECLRASPTLCSIILSGNNNLGHPDETFDLSGKRMSDWEYYKTHIYASETISITIFSTFYKEDKTVTVTPYVRKIYQPGWQHPYAHNDLPYPDFLKPMTALNTNKRKMPTSSTQGESVAINLIELPKSSQKVAQTIPTVHSIGLNKPTAKKKRAKKKSQSARSASLSVPSTTATTSTSTTKPKTIPKIKSSKVQAGASSPHSLLSTKNEDPLNQEPILKLDSDAVEDMVETPKFNLLETEPMIVSLSDWEGSSEDLKEESVQINQDKIIVCETNQKEPLITSLEYLPPKGMRSFHSHQSITPLIPQVILTGKQLKTLQKIFAKSYSPVKYGKIATLWRHINGLNSINESGGTSHKELLDRNGRVVMGISAHNNNTPYGWRTIKYIRDAFTRIGYGSSSF